MAVVFFAAGFLAAAFLGVFFVAVVFLAAGFLAAAFLGVFFAPVAFFGVFFAAVAFFVVVFFGLASVVAARTSPVVAADAACRNLLAYGVLTKQLYQ